MAHSEPATYQAETRATIRFVLWTLAWLVTLALAKFGPGLLWNLEQTTASWAAVANNLVVGLVWIVVFARFLQALDELQRRIIQDALAITLGIGWVGGFAYVVADSAGLVPPDINVAVFPIALAIVFMLAFALGKFRYR